MTNVDSYEWSWKYVESEIERERKREANEERKEGSKKSELGLTQTSTAYHQLRRACAKVAMRRSLNTQSKHLAHSKLLRKL